MNRLPFSHFSGLIQCNDTGPISSMEIAQLNIIFSGVTVKALQTVRLAPCLVSGFITVQSQAKDFKCERSVVLQLLFLIFLTPPFWLFKRSPIIQIILMFYYVTECSRKTTFRWYLLEFEWTVNARCLCYQSDMCVNSSSWPRSHWTTCVYLWASEYIRVCMLAGASECGLAGLTQVLWF